MFQREKRILGGRGGYFSTLLYEYLFSFSPSSSFVTACIYISKYKLNFPPNSLNYQIFPTMNHITNPSQQHNWSIFGIQIYKSIFICARNTIFLNIRFKKNGKEKNLLKIDIDKYCIFAVFLGNISRNTGCKSTYPSRNTSIDRNIGTHGYGNRYVFYRTMRENQGEEVMTLRDNRWKRKIAENGRNKE